MPRCRSRRTIALTVAGLATLSACGSDVTATAAGPSTTAASTSAPSSGPTSTTAAATFPVTVATPEGDLTVEARPTRIVSLSPTATEMLYAIGAGPQVLAVDDQSTYPAEAPRTDLSGFTPNLEAIVGYDPDLVVVGNDPGGLVDGLRVAGVPVLVQPAAVTLDDTYTQLEQLGAVTGNVGGAAEVVASMTTEIARLVDEVPERAVPLRYYHELDDTLYTVTSTTFIGNIYGLAGLENVADAADAEGSGYPQLSAEYLLQQDPDLIFLADTRCCGQSAATVASRPGWGELRAVQQGGVVELDDDVASRWGPRVVDFLAAVVAATAKVPAATG